MIHFYKYKVFVAKICKHALFVAKICKCALNERKGSLLDF